MKKDRLKVGIDCDDVVFYCNKYAIEKLNEEKGYNLDINDLKSWGANGSKFDERIAYFNDPEFYRTQPLIEGAVDFIKKLSQKAEIFFVTAVPSNCMSVRAQRIIECFSPYIKPSNIIMAERKDLVRLDILLDDGSHNILNTPATYGVLMRRPWNQNLSGNLSVNCYEDFLHIVDLICNSYSETPDLKDGGVVCLIGPSGSGKTAIMLELTKDNRFIKPITTTTRTKRDNEADDAYRFVSEDVFLKEKSENKFLESSVYSGYHYGTSANIINEIIDAGKYAVLPIDICGGITIKNVYRKKAILIFVDRRRQDVISEILSRNCSNDEKMKRIISLDNEYKNESFCDDVVRNDGTLDGAAKKVKYILKLI